MKTRFLCAVLLTLSLGQAQAVENRLAGKWTADVRSKGGLGATLIFTDKGGVTSTFGALVDFSYKVEGQMIKMSFPDNPQQAAEPYAFEGDKLVIYPADSQKRQVRTRVGAAQDGAPRIVGVWAFKHQTGPMAQIRYTQAGAGFLSIPMKTIKGRYRLKADTLTMEFKGQAPLSGKIRLDDDHLTLLGGGEKPDQAFTRVSP